jgi:AcrR family transcriptional regulator
MTLAADRTADATPLEEDWIAAAREMLIEGGVAAVQVNALATRLGVTRGGFYWRFRNRQDLLDHLIDNWRNTNTRAYLMALERAGTPQERFRRMIRLFLDEKTFKPALDAAIRQWAAVDGKVADKVRECDDIRIDALRRVFIDAGQDPLEALVRAKVNYFHQVGCYTLCTYENQERKDDVSQMYSRILTGFDGTFTV